MNRKIIRIIMAVFGVLVGGISVGFFRNSLFGTDPFQCFMNGIVTISPIDFGTLYTIVNVIMLVGVFFIDKHYIGLATLINIFLQGYVIEFSANFLYNMFGELGLFMRIVFLCIGIVVLCFSSAFYFTADLGVSAYDSIALILTDKKVAPFKYCRIGCDLICVVVGGIFGAIIGVGTVATAFFMGPLIDFFRRKISEPLLAKYPE